MDYLEFAKKTISREDLREHIRVGGSQWWRVGYALQLACALIGVLIDIAESLRSERRPFGEPHPTPYYAEDPPTED